MGVTVPLCAQKRVGDRTGTLLLSPDLVPSCPGPVLRGSRSWRYFCCLARIRSILEAQDAAQPAPPGVPHTRGCPKVHGERSQCPPKTHSLPLQLVQRLLLGSPVRVQALHDAGLEQRHTPKGQGTGEGQGHPQHPWDPPEPQSHLEACREEAWRFHMTCK